MSFQNFVLTTSFSLCEDNANVTLLVYNQLILSEILSKIQKGIIPTFVSLNVKV